MVFPFVRMKTDLFVLAATSCSACLRHIPRARIRNSVS
jgi:hypothetical protein